MKKIEIKKEIERTGTTGRIKYVYCFVIKYSCLKKFQNLIMLKKRKQKFLQVV